MDLNRYSYTTDDTRLSYEFTSSGARTIKKVVEFQLINPAKGIYNLAFGDFNERTGKMDDLSVSNNRDRDKVLATVAATVYDFSKKHPTATIFAIGSTSSRTRLYRMGITYHFENISAIFDVEGYDSSKGWVPFQSGNNYKAYSIKRKNP